MSWILHPESMRPDPLGVTRNPFHIFLFGVITANGLLLAFGLPTSAVLGTVLPRWAGITYGILMATGALLVLVGMYWQGHPGSGLGLKRTGYVGLAFAIGIYAISVFFVSGLGGLIAGSISAVFAIICAFQVRVINRRMHELIALDSEFRKDWGAD